MLSAEYQRILEAIRETSMAIPSWAIEARFKLDDPADDPRKFLAYVLGGDEPGNGGDEVVLAFQYAGPHMSTSDPTRNWRCFKVGDLRHPTNPASAVKVEKIALVLGAGAPVPPPHLLPPQVARQNCVPGRAGPGPDGREVRSVDYHT
jgi:hypothetical protein